MMAMMSQSLQASRAFFAAHPTVVLVWATLLYLLFGNRKQSENGKAFTLITAIAGVLVLCPLSGAFLIKYQTGLYGPVWIYSLVPMGALLAYVITLILSKPIDKKKEAGPKTKGKALTGLAAIGVLLLLVGIGEQKAVGMTDLPGKTPETLAAAAAKENGKQLAELLNGCDEGHERILWGPQEALEWIRCHDGARKVLYGRNMWEPQAAAYAYDSYEEELQTLFLWMETFTQECKTPEDAGIDRSVEDAFYLQLAYEQGAALWVMPQAGDARMASAIEKLEIQCGVKAQKKETQTGYTIWVLSL